MTQDNIISFENFGFKYKAQTEPTLYDINLQIKKGEKILIAGTSGCGKSTLAHCMNGLIPHSYKGDMTGSLKIAGKDAFKISLFEHSETVGTVLQDSDGQFIGLTVAEDIVFSLENKCIDISEMSAILKKVADRLNLSDFLSHAPHEVSGGQKQRVSLAGVMVGGASVLLFDEPLANLDPATGKATMELIDRIIDRLGCAVIIIEHRIEDVLHRHIDRVVLMDEGRIVFDDSPDILLSTDLLIKQGIREPLYVTALKYAGVDITADMKPASINALVLSEEQRALVAKWFEENEAHTYQNNDDIILSAKDVNFTYENGHKALKGISIDIRKGEMLSVVGMNGAGKSTFSKVVCGFEKLTSGSLSLMGRDITELSIKERADHIGYVMQNPNQMISKIMIRDEIALGLVNRGVPADEIDAKVTKAMKICGLYPFRNWPVSALSYGQKKRVTIASVLVLEPEIIILDEPTAGQDLAHYTEIMDFLAELNRQGITIILITHDMHLMLEYTKRAIVFHDGKVLADGSPAFILNNRELVECAHLRETSLRELARICDISDAEGFTERFIARDRKVRINND